MFQVSIIESIGSELFMVGGRNCYDSIDIDKGDSFSISIKDLGKVRISRSFLPKLTR